VTAPSGVGAGSRGAGSGLGRYVRLFGGIRPYERSWLSRDVVAGVTLAALAMPEVLGYSKIAGTPVITGLYTMLLPIVAFAIFGSSRHLVVGGDSATAAIMYAGIASLGIAGLQPGTSRWLALASLSALMSAVLLLFARLARLGFLANFISRTVLVGFLTGVGIQVAMGQLGGMLGVPSPHVTVGRTSGTVVTFVDTLREVGQTSGATLAVSLSVLATLVLFGRWIKAVPGGLVAVVGAIAVSWIFDLAAHGVSTLGHVPSGLPQLGFPSGVSWTQAGQLTATAVSMLIVIIAQSAATSRAYAVRYRERFVENDDLAGLTAANLAAGLSSTFVVNGSPTKLVDIANLREIWRLRQEEFWVSLATAAVVVGVGVEQGIILAIALSLILHVKRQYAPADRVVTWDAGGRPRLRPTDPGTTSEPGLVVYRFGVGLFYANAERLSEEVIGLLDVPEPPRWFVFLADAIDDIDYTGGKTLAELADQLSEREIVFAVAEARPRVRRQLDRFGVTAKIGENHYYDTLDAARSAYHAD